MGAVGTQHPQIFSKAEFAPTDFKGNPTGANILANKWMSHPGKFFCVGEELLSALVVIMILLKISGPGKS